MMKQHTRTRAKKTTTNNDQVEEEEDNDDDFEIKGSDSPSSDEDEIIETSNIEVWLFVLFHSHIMILTSYTIAGQLSSFKISSYHWPWLREAQTQQAQYRNN
jgi:hypothetical protein